MIKCARRKDKGRLLFTASVCCVLCACLCALSTAHQSSAIGRDIWGVRSVFGRSALDLLCKRLAIGVINRESARPLSVAICCRLRLYSSPKRF